MKKKSSLSTSGIAAAFTALLFIAGFAVVGFAEHPSEHPSGHSAGHKEKREAGITKEALSKAISGYIKKDAELKGGYFLVYDGVDKKPLALTLAKVHDDRLAKVDDGIYFACVDLKSSDGAVYDLDFFMKDTGGGDLDVTEIAVHKKEGKARYDWREENGIWKKTKK